MSAPEALVDSLCFHNNAQEAFDISPA
jgi:hypothetical protein